LVIPAVSSFQFSRQNAPGPGLLSPGVSVELVAQETSIHNFLIATDQMP